MKNKKYIIEIDYGKPYTEEVNTEEEVFKILKELEDKNQKEDYAYFDINIYQDASSQGNPKIPYVDVTEDFFKMYQDKFKKEFEVKT